MYKIRREQTGTSADDWHAARVGAVCAVLIFLVISFGSQVF